MWLKPPIEKENCYNQYITKNYKQFIILCEITRTHKKVCIAKLNGEANNNKQQKKKRNNKEVKRWRKYPLTIVKTIKALSHYSHRIQWTQLKAIQKNRIHTLCTMLQQWNGPNKLYSALYLYGGYKNTIFRRIIVYKMRRFDGYCMGCGYGYDMKSCSCM